MEDTEVNENNEHLYFIRHEYRQQKIKDKGVKVTKSFQSQLPKLKPIKKERPLHALHSRVILTPASKRKLLYYDAT